jgi:hypothetical protein
VTGHADVRSGHRNPHLPSIGPGAYAFMSVWEIAASVVMVMHEGQVWPKRGDEMHAVAADRRYRNVIARLEGASDGAADANEDSLTVQPRR